MNASIIDQIAAAISTRLTASFVLILTEELAKVDLAASVGEPTVPLSEYVTVCERLDGILGDVGCGSMEVPEAIDMDEVADQAADAVRDALRYFDAPDMDELREQAEQAERAVQEAQALRTHMQETIERQRQNGNGVSPEAEAVAATIPQGRTPGDGFEGDIEA